MLTSMESPVNGGTYTAGPAVQQISFAVVSSLTKLQNNPTHFEQLKGCFLSIYVGLLLLGHVEYIVVRQMPELHALCAIQLHQPH